MFHTHCECLPSPAPQVKRLHVWHGVVRPSEKEVMEIVRPGRPSQQPGIVAAWHGCSRAGPPPLHPGVITANRIIRAPGPCRARRAPLPRPGCASAAAAARPGWACAGCAACWGCRAHPLQPPPPPAPPLLLLLLHLPPPPLPLLPPPPPPPPPLLPRLPARPPHLQQHRKQAKRQRLVSMAAKRYCIAASVPTASGGSSRADAAAAPREPQRPSGTTQCKPKE